MHDVHCPRYLFSVPAPSALPEMPPDAARKSSFPQSPSSDDAVEALLEPLNCLVAVDFVVGADSALAAPPAGDALAGAGHATVEVHAVDTDARVVLDTQVDVLADAEAEIAGFAEVALAELVLLDLQATLKNLLRLGPADRDVYGDLLVSSDAKGSNRVAGLACGGNAGLALNMELETSMDVRRTVDGRFGRSAARAPWPLSSICHQTRRRRC